MCKTAKGPRGPSRRKTRFQCAAPLLCAHSRRSRSEQGLLLGRVAGAACERHDLQQGARTGAQNQGNNQRRSACLQKAPLNVAYKIGARSTTTSPAPTRTACSAPLCFLICSTCPCVLRPLDLLHEKTMVPCNVVGHALLCVLAAAWAKGALYFPSILSHSSVQPWTQATPIMCRLPVPKSK